MPRNPIPGNPMRCRPVLRRVLTGLAALPLPLGGLVAVSAVAPPAVAQDFDADPVATQLKRQTLARLMKRVTIELEDQRLEDVITFIETFTQTDLDPLWFNDRTNSGLDPDTFITVSVKNVTALSLLEQVLEKADRNSGVDESTWQFTKSGAFEFGPKERLNRRDRLVIYDITDLLTEVPNYDNAPDFDLNTIFQQGGQTGGGGGGASPFQGGQQDVDRQDREEKAQEVVDLIVTTVEPEQGLDNGGEAATVRYFRGSLIVRAPDYVHRQLVGYPWWPARFQRARVVEGRRYVTLNADTAIGTVDFDDTVRAFAVTGP
jgi:hypothetical protein